MGLLPYHELQLHALLLRLTCRNIALRHGSYCFSDLNAAKPQPVTRFTAANSTAHVLMGSGVVQKKEAVMAFFPENGWYYKHPSSGECHGYSMAVFAQVCQHHCLSAPLF